MKFTKKFFLIIIFILNALALITLLLAAFSDRVSPFREVFFSYLGLFFPFIFLFNLLLFFVWIFTKQWKLAGMNFLVFLICISSIHTYFTIHLKTKDIPDDCIKILTYNVMRFGYPDVKKQDESNKILQFILDNDADIVCIQEFGISDYSFKMMKKKDITSLINKYPYNNLDKFPKASEIYGNAIFSKFPILSEEKVPYKSYAYDGSVVFELDVKGKKVTLINNHLESNKLSQEERDDYFKMTQDMNSRSFDVFTKMMTKRLTPSYKQRALQAQMISKIIDENKNPYIIVCGDFNDTPISYTRHKIKGNLRDAFVDTGCGLGITYNRYRFLFRIDYILYNSNIKAYNCTVGSLSTSDHYPVWCYLQLK